MPTRVLSESPVLKILMMKECTNTLDLPKRLTSAEQGPDSTKTSEINKPLSRIPNKAQ